MSSMANPMSTGRPNGTRQLQLLSATLCLILGVCKPVYATEAIIIGGGSNVQNASERFETTVKWLQSVLYGNDVDVSTYYNDGSSPLHDTTFQTNDQVTALARVFGKANTRTLYFREHQLMPVQGGSELQSLQPAITSKLTADTQQELLLISVGLGVGVDISSSNGNGNGNHAQDLSGIGAALQLWNNTQLDTTQLHHLVHQHDRPVRYVFAHDHSGSFHRLAYKDPANGLILSDKRHCGFTSTTAYGHAESSTPSSDISNYQDYASIFFSTLSGYELDGEIISRFSDLNKDGVTSLREAHLYTLEEARSIELSLSSSEDYLLRWQPWYLRWKPASTRLPNNEYTRIFRDLASAFNIELEGNVARNIRQRMDATLLELQALKLQHKERLLRINELQGSLMSDAIRQWPALAAPYTKGYEQLIKEQQLAKINTSLSQNTPDYTELVELQKQIEPAQMLMQNRQREVTQYNKLLRLRHLALLKQQLFDHGNAENVSDYRSLVECEEAPLSATANYTVLSEDTTQVQ